MNKVGQVSSFKASALGKGGALLEAIARRPGLEITGIRQRPGMPKSSSHHLISTMCELGPITRKSLGGYAMRRKLLKLAGIANESNDLPRDAMPLLRKYTQRVLLTCHFAGFEQGDAIHFACVGRGRGIIGKSHVRKRLPFSGSALGESLMACLAPERRDIVMADLDFERRMPKTATNPADVCLELADVRRRGLMTKNRHRTGATLQHRSAIATASWSPQSMRSERWSRLRLDASRGLRRK